MIYVRELQLGSQAIELLPNGETAGKMAQFINYLGALAYGLESAKASTAYGLKATMTTELYSSNACQNGKALFNNVIEEDAEYNINVGMSRNLVPWNSGHAALERLGNFELHKHYQLLTHDNLLSSGSDFKAMDGNLEDAFTPSENEYRLARKLKLNRQAVQVRVTNNLQPDELSDVDNQQHTSLGYRDELGDYQPVVTVLNDWYVKRMMKHLTQDSAT